MTANQPAKPAVPIITYILIGFTILVYVLELLSETLLGTNIPVILGAKHNLSIMAGQIWRLFTPIFLHGSVFHILLQMFWLYIMGRGLEPLFGKLRFFLLYVISGFIGIVFSFLLTKNVPDDITIGSGVALFGLISAQVAYLFINRTVYGERAWDSLRSIGIIIGVNIAFSLLPGMDRIAPIGGLFGGLLFSWFAAPKLKVELRKVEERLIYVVNDVRSPSQAIVVTVLILVVGGVLTGIKIAGWWPI